MNMKDLLTKATIEVEHENRFDNIFFEEEYPIPFFSKELRKENAKAKKYTVETKENGEWFEFLVKTQKNEILKRFISTDNVSFKLSPVGEHYEIINFSYEGTNFPKLPEENLNFSVSGESMYIENEKYILRDNNSFGTVALFEKNKTGKKKYLFGFEYDVSFQGNELLEIIKIDDCKNKKDIAKYFKVILEMFEAVHKYIKEENGNNKLESYKRIIPKKISSL